MKSILPILFLACATSCSYLSDLKSTVDKAESILSDSAQAYASADTNKDGKVSGWGEWAVLASSLAGAFGLYKVNGARVKATDELYDDAKAQAIRLAERS